MKITRHQPFSLRAIVTELISAYMHTENKSLQIINNISSDLKLYKAVDGLAPLISDLLSILSNANGSQPILISAMKINGGYKLYAPANNSSLNEPAYNRVVKQFPLPAN